MTKIRDPKDMPPLDKHQWQNLVLQVDTATEEREALMDKVKQAEARALAIHKDLEDERKAHAETIAAVSTAQERINELGNQVSEMTTIIASMSTHPDVIMAKKAAKVEAARMAKEQYERALAEAEGEIDQ